MAEDSRHQSAAVKRYRERFIRMDSARADMEAERKYCDLQVQSSVKTDGFGKLLINIPIERVLLDINDGKYSGPIMFDVSGGQEDNSVEKTEPVFHAMNDFLDKEGFYRQKMAGIRDRGTYGTMAWFTGIRENTFLRYEPKEVFDGLYSTDMKAIKRVEYKFTPLNRPLYSVWIDDQSMNQWDHRKADDGIIEEQITPEAAKIRFGDMDGIDLNRFKPYAITDPYYGKYNDYPNQVLISHYYNKVTSEWDITLNKVYELHSGRYYHQGNLPITLAQQFFDNNSPYGEGYPKRVRAMKGYKKSVLQDILDASKMSAGINLIVPSGTKVNAKVGSGINIRESTNSAGMQPVPMQTRINDMASVLAIIDDMIIQDAGENVKAPYTSPKTTLGEIEFMEEKQQMRDRGVEQNLNFCYDDILTKTAINLTKYAVNLVKSTETGKKIKINKPNGQTEEMDGEIQYFPDLSIKVKDHVVERKESKDGKVSHVFREDFGSEGYFSLKDCDTKGEFMVKIVTPSTKMTNTIQKNSFTQAVQNLQVLAQTFQMFGMNLGDEIKKEMNPENIIAKWKELYEIDPKLMAKTKKGEINAEIEKEKAVALELMGNDMGAGLLSPTPPTNAPTQTNGQNPIPSIPEAPKAPGSPAGLPPSGGLPVL